MKRIGLLTSGGDCQALNAAMRGVVKGLANNLNELEVYGFMNGYKGLIYGDYRMLTSRDFSGILTRGGTILGTSRESFKEIREPGEKGINKVDAMKQNYYKLRLDCLVILGGNGTQKTANLLREEGLNILHLPKTIDNDIYGTDMTFGFYSAVNIATHAIDCIHTTASSHRRVFIIEIMGHKVGWLTLYAGIAGGADVILLPEIPYDINKIVKAINERTARGSGFTIIAVAEGAIPKDIAKMDKKDRKKAMEQLLKKYRSISYKIADDLEKNIGTEVRVTVPGHMQRGGSPCPYDRVLSTRLGSEAAKLILNEDYGYMVAIVNGKIKKVPLGDVAGKLKGVDPKCQEIESAKRMGISFGD
ncbi:MAG: 6-phosphofructokinase [Bilifractor sp.]|jgi:6-phosphofructokinase